MKKLLLILIFVIFLVGCSYEEIKEETTSKIKKFPIENSCKQKASELIPDYLSLSPNSIRSGSDTGENVNYYYLINPPITYSKQIVDENGLILGTRYFEYTPILKLSDINFNIELKDRIETNTGGFIQESFTGVSWSGFTDEVKEIFNTDSISFEIVESKITGTVVLIDESYNQSEGEIDLGTRFKSGYQGGYYWSTGEKCRDGILLRICKDNLRLKITPNSIITNRIYEVIDYEINNCEWVE